MKKQQESLKNMVYQAILNGIFTDEYKPNQIINEQELLLQRCLLLLRFCRFYQVQKQ